MRENSPETRNALVDLQLLLADYWREVDSNGAVNAGSFFTEDGIFEVGDIQTYHGPAGVNEFHRTRLARGARTTMHTFSNVTVELETPDRAAMSAVTVNYGADGTPPITELAGPSLVAQLRITAERGKDGAWRFSSMRGEPMFIGTDKYTRQTLLEKR